MKLRQRLYPFGSVTFTVSDTAVRVEEKRLLKSRSFEIPLRAIASSDSSLKQFPLLWCIVAVGATLATMAGLVGVFVGIGDTAGAIACVLLGSVFSALAWHGFFERKFDLVMLHSRESGNGIIVLRRADPTARHVEEFIEIVKERSADE